MAYINDYGAIKAKIEKYEWARKVYEPMKESCDWFVENWHDDPARVCGWGHHYVCQKCGTSLKFDKNNPGAQICPACGHANYGRAIEAWNCSYRGSADGNAFHAAILYKLTGEKKYLDYIKKILNFYLENYEKLNVWVVHPMYLGRLTGQHLTDDGSVIQLITAMSIVRDELDESFVKELGDKFFLRQGRFLKPFCYYINNIPVWDLCAIATIGLFYHDDELVDYAFNSEYGLINQVKLGLTKDNFWYEGSVHYHFYCISPMTNLYYYAVSSGYKADFIEQWGRTLKAMYVLPAQLAFENGCLPNPNDGWPYITLANFGAAYDTISACFDDPMLKWVCANVYDGRIPNITHEGEYRANAGGMQRLLFGLMPEDYDKYKRPYVGTRVWADTNFSELRKDGLEVFFKYGLIIGAHSHFDIMNFELYRKGEMLSYDLSTNGYGSFLFQWQQGSLSHNTVVTDMSDMPKKGKGELLEFDEAKGRIKALNRDVYPGVDYTRELVASDGCLDDVFECKDGSGTAHTYDYMFYCNGEQSCDCESESCEPLEGRLYDLLLEPKVIDNGKTVTVTYTTAKSVVKMIIEGCEGSKVYLFDSYAQTKDLRRRGVMIRRCGKPEATFKVRYETSDR